MDLNLDQDSQEDIIVKLTDEIQRAYESYLEKIYYSAISFPDPAGSQVSVVDGEEIYVSVVTYADLFSLIYHRFLKGKKK